MPLVPVENAFYTCVRVEFYFFYGRVFGHIFLLKMPFIPVCERRVFDLFLLLLFVLFFKAAFFASSACCSPFIPVSAQSVFDLLRPRIATSTC